MLVLFLSDQNWPYWNHITEQSGGAVVCHGLVGFQFYIFTYLSFFISMFTNTNQTYARSRLC